MFSEHRSILIMFSAPSSKLHRIKDFFYKRYRCLHVFLCFKLGAPRKVFKMWVFKCKAPRFKPTWRNQRSEVTKRQTWELSTYMQNQKRLQNQSSTHSDKQCCKTSVNLTFSCFFHGSSQLGRPIYCRLSTELHRKVIVKLTFNQRKPRKQVLAPAWDTGGYV